MNVRKSTWLGLALTGLVALPALADGNVWLTSRVKIALLTADGVNVTGVDVESVEGAVTLHGAVRTDVEKEKATQVVRSVDGVKSVRNLLQVVPDASKTAVKATDEAIKDRILTALRSGKGVTGITVTSVNNGVVLLSGKASTSAEKLRAIELAWNVECVSRVASEIETEEKGVGPRAVGTIYKAPPSRGRGPGGLPWAPKGSE